MNELESHPELLFGNSIQQEDNSLEQYGRDDFPHHYEMKRGRPHPDIIVWKWLKYAWYQDCIESLAIPCPNPCSTQTHHFCSKTNAICRAGTCPRIAANISKYRQPATCWFWVYRGSCYTAAIRGLQQTITKTLIQQQEKKRIFHLSTCSSSTSIVYIPFHIYVLAV